MRRYFVSGCESISVSARQRGYGVGCRAFAPSHLEPSHSHLRTVAPSHLRTRFLWFLERREQRIGSRTVGEPTIRDAVVDETVLVCRPRQDDHTCGSHAAPPGREMLRVDDNDLPHGPSLDFSDVALHRQGEPPRAEDGGKLLSTSPVAIQQEDVGLPKQSLSEGLCAHSCSR